MLVITDASDLPRITNPEIQELVALRLQQLEQQLQQLSPDTSNATPYEFIVVEAGDPVSEVEQAAGFPILTSLFDDLPYTDPDFFPCHELLEKFTYGNTCIYEMVFIGSDDGAATCVLIPDTEGVDADLLALCRAWAVPAMNTQVNTP
jgi:hypothetical protein